MTGTDETLLLPNPNRYVILPIEHQDIWELYEKQRKAFWWDHEVAFTDTDRRDWDGLNKNEKHFLENILAFFAASDGIVMDNVTTNFINRIQVKEAIFLYTLQNQVEAIHSLVYSKLIEFYVTEPKRRRELLSALETIPCIQNKAEWSIRWIGNGSLAEQLIAQACVEGIFFSGAFCAIYWMKESGKLPALTFSNHLIARDERNHVDTSVLLYTKMVKNKLNDSQAHAIIKECVALEKEFIIHTFNCDLIGMNAKLMSQYIDYVAHRLCLRLGHGTLFGSKTPSNPFAFMELIAFDSKENFFETRTFNYQLHSSTLNLDVNKINFEKDQF